MLEGKTVAGEAAEEKVVEDTLVLTLKKKKNVETQVNTKFCFDDFQK